MEDAQVEDAGIYLAVVTSQVKAQGSASDQQKTKYLYAVSDTVNKLFQ